MGKLEKKFISDEKMTDEDKIAELKKELADVRSVLVGIGNDVELRRRAEELLEVSADAVNVGVRNVGAAVKEEVRELVEEANGISRGAVDVLSGRVFPALDSVGARLVRLERVMLVFIFWEVSQLALRFLF